MRLGWGVTAAGIVGVAVAMLAMLVIRELIDTYTAMIDTARAASNRMGI